MGIGAGNTFAQKTFADSLKLPYPLLSDFPKLEVIRRYGALSESRQITARRAFFLVDQQGIVRQRWFPENEGFLPSEPILQAVRAIGGRR